MRMGRPEEGERVSEVAVRSVEQSELIAPNPLSYMGMAWVLIIMW